MNQQLICNCNLTEENAGAAKSYKEAQRVILSIVRSVMPNHPAAHQMSGFDFLVEQQTEIFGA
jgi:hypothetical protein